MNNVGICEKYGGAVIFIGGGDQMDSGIERSLEGYDTDVFLLVPNPSTTLEDGNDGGASTRWANHVLEARKSNPEAYPRAHIVTCGENLGRQMKRVMG